MPETFIHPLAYVDDNCQIGRGTRINHFASVTRGTILGENCVVWPFAMLDGSSFGDRCKIASGVAMGAGFLVGNDVFIGPNVTICNDMWPSVDKEGYDDYQLRLGVKFAVIIEDGVSIGAGAVILPGVRIGKRSVIAAGTVVGVDVPPSSLFVQMGPQFDYVGMAEHGPRMRWAR